MEVFVIIAERSGIYEFHGIGLSEDDVRDKKRGLHHAIILKEEIDEGRLVDGEIYVAGAYDICCDHADYRGIYYSIAEARRAAGNPSFIFAHHLPVHHHDLEHQH